MVLKLSYQIQLMFIHLQFQVLKQDDALIFTIKKKKSLGTYVHLQTSSFASLQKAAEHQQFLEIRSSASAVEFFIFLFFFTHGRLITALPNFRQP